MSKLTLVLAGAGDHARVLIDVIKENGYAEFREWNIAALTDARPELHGQSVMGIPVTGNDSTLHQLRDQGIEHALVGVGLAAGIERRAAVYEVLVSADFELPVLLHPSALVASRVEIDAGSVVLGGAIIGTKTRVGKNTVVNIGAALSHDCVLEDHAVVCDGAHITGGVRIGEGALIGAGATILPYLTIGRNGTVAAGAVVTKNVEDNAVVAGVPARAIRSNN